jgi:predicted phosphodiesterase
MRVLVLSDIHANLEALEAVLDDAAKAGYGRIWFLGDAVGYGPDPNACLDRLLALEPEVWLAGNHDWAALGRLDLGTFNPEARHAAEWTDRELRADLRAFLETVEPRQVLPDLDLCLVHGSPRHPIWEYILDAGVAADCFGSFDASLCFFGHTHVPVVYEEGVDGALRLDYRLDEPLPLADLRILANPGSVGQPRDGDARASYALFDPETRQFRIRRVAYDIAAVQAKIEAAGLPPRLAARLDYGW